MNTADKVLYIESVIGDLELAVGSEDREKEKQDIIACKSIL